MFNDISHSSYISLHECFLMKWPKIELTVGKTDISLHNSLDKDILNEIVLKYLFSIL